MAQKREYGMRKHSAGNKTVSVRIDRYPTRYDGTVMKQKLSDRLKTGWFGYRASGTSIHPVIMR